MDWKLELVAGARPTATPCVVLVWPAQSLQHDVISRPLASRAAMSSPQVRRYKRAAPQVLQPE